MSRPYSFSWINEPLLAAMVEPLEYEEFVWLRQQGIQLVVSLTEQPPRRDWINDAGLMLLHEPVEDMTPPSQDQLDKIVSSIASANKHGMGVAVHCAAGLGRTGVIMACCFVDAGESSEDAIIEVRNLRPGSIETRDQEDAVREFARRKRNERKG
jgi:atypical dual specificity phosphatase